MQTKTFVLLALSASAALASPFHKRQEQGHRHRHRTGTGSRPTGIRPTGSGSPFPAGNDTEGFFAPTAITNTELATLVVTKTVSPIPAESGEVNTFGNVVADTSSSCTTTSIATETSTNFVTVTAEPLANTKVIETNGNSVSAGAFYGGQGSRSWGGNWGQSSNAPAAGSSAIATFQPSAANPSTTFATATKSSVPSSSASTASSGSSSGGKRGISFNDASLISAFSGKVSWAYNWASSESGSMGGVEYVPMAWGRNDVSTIASKIGSATHVLGFNEPDLAEQANIPAAEAASLHKQMFSGLKGKIQIGSPAVTNGEKNPDGSPMGANYLEAFFNACGSDCPVDFVAYHWYATADSFDYFKTHTEAIVAVAQKHGINKVWLTEFKPDGSAAAQAAFMTQAIAYLEGNSAIERYAGFMTSEGTLLSGSTLNSVGKAYAGM